VRGLISPSENGGQGQDRTVDLPLSGCGMTVQD
jgi:hypothetical protein